MRILYCSDILNVHDRCLLEGLATSGHEVAVATFHHRSGELPEFVRRFRVFREVFRAYPDGVRGSRFGPLRALQYRREERRAVRAMRGWLEAWTPDVVFASWAITAGYVAARAEAKPLALFPWGSDVLVLPDLRRWYRRRAVAALQAASLWICNARHTADRARRLAGGSPRIEILPCEVDAGVFSPEKADRSEFGRLWPGKKVVMCTRPLKDLYDHGTILRAMERTRAALFVAGEGPLLETLRRSARGDVHFAGRIEHDRLLPLLAACDAYVSAARSDSASLGVFEAMACARPVVASDIPANREWIEDGVSGRLFRTGDPADLAEKLETATTDGAALGAVARKTVLERADRRTNLPRLVGALESLR